MRIGVQMWPSLIGKAKEGGLHVIQTYVFWNLHEPQSGQVLSNCHINLILIPCALLFLITIYRNEILYMQYNFSGRYDIVKFIKEIHAQGLYACLRIGPFIESEWTYGYVLLCMYS